MRTRRAALILASGFALLGGACTDLAVPNKTSPDIDRVFGSPASIEQTIASGYQSCHNAVTNGVEADAPLMPQLSTLALEMYGQIGNFGIGARVGIPRAPIQNAGSGGISIYGDYSRLALGGRLAANAVGALERLMANGGTIGVRAQDLRARAFGYFVIGCHQAWLAMVYDSAAIVTPGMQSEVIPPLRDAAAVMQGAFAMFDSAITVAGDSIANTSGGFPLPTTWLNSTNATTRDDFIRLVRSFRARFRAGVARDPAQRAAVDWNAVIDDVLNGNTGDFLVNAGGSVGWRPGFGSGGAVAMAPMYFGMADTSGGYEAWLAKPLTSRGVFVIATPDRRWPQGTTRSVQQTNSPLSTSLNFRPYIRNLTGEPVGDPWGVSYYGFQRMRYFIGGVTAAYPDMTKAELDLLAAEGYIRTGNVAAAAARIDITRVARGQLPALAGVITTTSQAVPGGTSCVPRVPAPPNFTSTVCGNLLEAMKWEKRMETALTGYGQWYFDSRGWGDLIVDSAYEFPVPWQELAARQRPFYTLGGGGKSSAQRGTYGF